MDDDILDIKVISNIMAINTAKGLTFIGHKL